MKRLMYMVLFIIGFILEAGTVGAADLEKISLLRLVLQSLIAAVFIAVAFMGLNLEEKRETNRRGKSGKRKDF